MTTPKGSLRLLARCPKKKSPLTRALLKLIVAKDAIVEAKEEAVKIALQLVDAKDDLLRARGKESQLKNELRSQNGELMHIKGFLSMRGAIEFAEAGPISDYFGAMYQPLPKARSIKWQKFVAQSSEEELLAALEKAGRITGAKQVGHFIAQVYSNLSSRVHVNYDQALISICERFSYPYVEEKEGKVQACSKMNKQEEAEERDQHQPSGEHEEPSGEHEEAEQFGQPQASVATKEQNLRDGPSQIALDCEKKRKRPLRSRAARRAAAERTAAQAAMAATTEIKVIRRPAMDEMTQDENTARKKKIKKGGRKEEQA